MDPANLRFAKSHEWVAVDGDTATIGISSFAVEALTDLVFLQLPDVGTSFSAGDVFGDVESVKAASDLYAPVSGEISGINDDLPNDLGIMSDDPYGKGWMIRINMSNSDEVNGLMDHAAYQEFCASEK